MDRAVPFAEEGLIRILRPPQELKPSPGFLKLLAEYRNWVSATRKKGSDAFLAFRHERLSPGEALWDIRGSLRPPEDSDAIPFREKILKWNLVLHLAQEIEDQGREADRLLEHLRKRSSPLGDLLQEEVDGHPLADLPPLETEFSRNSMDQVLEAWVSLFEGQEGVDDFLLTFSRGIFDRLGEKWEEEGLEGHSPMIELLIPDFSDLGPDELVEGKSRFLQSEVGAILRNSVMECGMELPVNAPERPPRAEANRHMMKIIVRCFSPVPRSSSFMRRFAGKRVCLIGD